MQNPGKKHLWLWKLRLDIGFREIGVPRKKHVELQGIDREYRQERCIA
jgi:hypothetical protein